MPPRWATALLTWATLSPVLLVVLVALAPLVDGLPLVPRTLIATAIVVPLMTYIVTPAVDRAVARVRRRPRQVVTTD